MMRFKDTSDGKPLPKKDVARAKSGYTQDMLALKSKVRTVHVETHSENAWVHVERGLTALGFRVLRNNTWLYTRYSSAQFGPVWWRGGSIWACNANLEKGCDERIRSLL